MSSPTPIRGKVARMLSARQLAMNIGERDGVALGMRFDVLDQKGEDIEDPDTGEVLGSLHRPKVRLRVVQVEDRISVGETFRSHRVNVGGMGLDFGTTLARALMPPQWVERHETLKTTETTWQDLDESESFVKTGDPVIQVLDIPEVAPEVLGSD